MILNMPYHLSCTKMCLAILNIYVYSIYDLYLLLLNVTSWMRLLIFDIRLQNGTGLYVSNM